jgi:predicted  nucleic acid-binding Zn-ribbon protein
VIESCDKGHSYLRSGQQRCPWCEIKRLVAELADAIASIDTLHDQRRAAEDERDALREEIERLRAENAALRKKLQNAVEVFPDFDAAKERT